MDRRRKTILAIAAALLLVALVRPPSADIEILTHSAADQAPHKVLAAVDLGIAAVSVLVTWTGGDSIH